MFSFCSEGGGVSLSEFGKILKSEDPHVSFSIVFSQVCGKFAMDSFQCHIQTFQSPEPIG